MFFKLEVAVLSASKSYFKSFRRFVHISRPVFGVDDDECKNPKPKPKVPIRDGPLLRKVAIVTGGAGGIGKACAKEMLKKALEGVVIADINEAKGIQVVNELRAEFGKSKALFVKCDVTKAEMFDWTFKQTLKCYGHLDIVINNAGVLNDKQWEYQIHTNMCGCVIGSLLGLQYMSKCCCGNGGTVVNVASVMAMEPYSGCPVHTMTQYGILGLTRALGYGMHYDRTCVKFMGLCPGFTATPLMDNALCNTLNKRFSEELKCELLDVELQDPYCVGTGLLMMLQRGENASIWVAEDGCKPYKVQIPTLDVMKDR